MKKADKALYRNIGRQLRDARNAKKLSLQYISDAMGGAKSKQTIMRYENGDTRISTDDLEVICNLLGLVPKEVIRKAKEQDLYHEYQQNPTPDLTAEEIVLVEKYRSVDDRTRKMVQMLLEMDLGG